jgi:hypothetical protein
MSTNSNPKLTRFVKVLVDVIYYLLVGASLFLVLWIVFSPFILQATGAPITASVPVAIEEGPEPRFEVEVAGSQAKGVRYAFVDEAQGTLRLETTNWIYVAISNLAKLVTAIALTYVFYLLRALLRNIEGGEPFTAQSVALMRRMGWAVLLIAFLRPTVEYLAALEVLRRLQYVDPTLSLPSPFQSEVLLASLLILILAQVWSYGLELERERALTI